MNENIDLIFLFYLIVKKFLYYEEKICDYLDKQIKINNFLSQTRNIMCPKFLRLYT